MRLIMCVYNVFKCVFLLSYGVFVKCIGVNVLLLYVMCAWVYASVREFHMCSVC